MVRIPLAAIRFLPSNFKAPSLEGEYDQTERISCWKDVRHFQLAEGRSPERGALPSARVHCDASDIAGK
jgi:hypothetical protein